jgi:hypothetical protein
MHPIPGTLSLMRSCIQKKCIIVDRKTRSNNDHKPATKDKAVNSYWPPETRPEPW